MPERLRCVTACCCCRRPQASKSTSHWPPSPSSEPWIDRSTLVEFEPDVRLRICSAEDLLVMKAFADRAQDRADVIGIARRRGPFLDWDAILERLAPLAEAKEQPDILDTVRKLRDSVR